MFVPIDGDRKVIAITTKSTRETKIKTRLDIPRVYIKLI